jgi:hypothetical protein
MINIIDSKAPSKNGKLAQKKMTFEKSTFMRSVAYLYVVQFEVQGQCFACPCCFKDGG